LKIIASDDVNNEDDGDRAPGEIMPEFCLDNRVSDWPNPDR